jgi:hypothetical protein
MLAFPIVYGTIAYLNLLSFVPVLEAHDRNSFHKTAHAVSQELAAGLEGSVYPNVVFRREKEIRGLWGMV